MTTATQTEPPTLAHIKAVVAIYIAAAEAIDALAESIVAHGTPRLDEGRAENVSCVDDRYVYSAALERLCSALAHGDTDHYL